MDIQEIIDLLKNIRIEAGKAYPDWATIQTLAADAWSIIEQQLTAGEFTIKMRRIYMPKDPRIAVPIEWEYILKLCDRLDRAEAENKRLKDTLAKDFNEATQRLFKEVGLDKLQVRLDTAEAENQKLKNQKEYIYKKEVAQLKTAESLNADLLEAVGPFVRLADMIPAPDAPEPQWEKLNTAIRALPLDRYREAQAAIAKATKEG